MQSSDKKKNPMSDTSVPDQFRTTHLINSSCARVGQVSDIYRHYRP